MSFFRYAEQIKSADKKFYRCMVGTIIVLCASTAIPLYLYISNRMTERTLSEYTTTLAQYAISESRPNLPSDERLSYLSHQLNTLKEKYDTVRPLFIPQTLKSGYNRSALDFKELLFATKQSLITHAKSRGISFPEEYGLHPYEHQLPNEKELPELFFYIGILEEIYSALIAADVHTINSCIFADTTRHSFSRGDTAEYSKHRITLHFTGTITALSSVIEALAKSPLSYVVNVCKISRPETEEKEQDPEIISIQLHIDVVTLPIDNKGDRV